MKRPILLIVLFAILNFPPLSAIAFDRPLPEPEITSLQAPNHDETTAEPTTMTTGLPNERLLLNGAGTQSAQGSEGPRSGSRIARPERQARARSSAPESREAPQSPPPADHGMEMSAGHPNDILIDANGTAANGHTVTWRGSVDRRHHVCVQESERPTGATRRSTSTRSASMSEIPSGSAPKTYYYALDQVGTTTVMTDESGEVVWSGEATPFGDQVTESGSLADEEALKYQGKDYDPATGLVYMNARWYDPEVGRFITVDPARSGINWVAFANNSPVRYVDPSGLRDEVGDGVTYNQASETFSSYGNFSMKESTYLNIDRSAGHTNGHYRSTIEVRAGATGSAVLYSNDVQSWADRRGGEGTILAGTYEGLLYDYTGSYDNPIGLVNEDLGVSADDMIMVHPNEITRGYRAPHSWSNTGSSDACQITQGQMPEFNRLTGTLEAAGYRFGTGGYRDYTDTIDVRVNDPSGLFTTRSGTEIRTHNIPR